MDMERRYERRRKEFPRYKAVKTSPIVSLENDSVFPSPVGERGEKMCKQRVIPTIPRSKTSFQKKEVTRAYPPGKVTKKE